MEYRQIIKDAWNFTQSNKRLVTWYAFLPALITTIYSLGYFIYQYFAFANSSLFSEEDKNTLMIILKEVYGFLKDSPKLIGPTIAIAIFLTIMYVFYPIIAQGALIQLIARKRNNQPVRLISGISYGLKSFLKLFEYSLVIRAFSVTAVLTEGAFVLRNLGVEALQFLLPVLGLLILIGIFLGFIFTYSELFIVIDKEGVFKSMRSSTALVVDHWQHTILILILLFIIGLRVILNIVMVLIIPLLIFTGVGLAATAALGYIGYAIGGLIALIGLYFSGYLGGTLTVFSNAVWVFTFLELTENGETSARQKESSSEE
jgi:hypothetical protein